MGDIRSRLTACFQGVFPDLTDDQIHAATVGGVAEWDSLANFSLITVVEEEFGFQFPPDDIDHLRSFADVESYLRSHPPA